MNAELDRLAAFLHARDDADDAVAPALRSKLYPGINDEIVVLLHGLTASPPAWKAIAEQVAALGYTVVTLRLPLHGHANRLTSALTGLSAELLTSDLRTVMTVVAAARKHITVGGHSLGGTLALYAAATLPEVERVVAIAPFLGVAGVPHEVHAAFIAALRRAPNVFVWWDPIRRSRQGPQHSYPRYPLHALGIGIELSESVYVRAWQRPRTCTIDIVVNQSESSVNNRAIRRLAARLRKADMPVTLYRLNGLPPSHDIIEPLKPHSARVRGELARLLTGERLPGSTRYAV